MNESDVSEKQGRLPAQQAQQPQAHQTQPAVMTAVDGGCAGARGKSVDSDPEGSASPSNAAFDDARFTAGVVKLYEALLKEPVPEEMLRLIEQIGKQERK